MADEGAVVADQVENTPVSTEAASAAAATPVAQEQVQSPASTPAPAVESTPSPTPLQDAIELESLRRAGFNFASKEEVLAGLGAVRENATAWRQAATEYEKIRPHLSEFERWRAEQNRPVPPPPPAEDPLAPPKIDRAMLARFTTRNEQGQSVLSPDAPSELRGQIEKYRMWKATFAERWDSDPDGYIKERGYIHKDELQKQLAEMESKFNSRVEQEFQGRELQKQAAERLEARRAQVTDATGNMTAYGRAYLAAVDKAENVYGIHNPADVDEYADAMASRMTAAAQVSTAQAEQQIRRAAGLPAAVSATPTRVSPAQPNAATPAFPNILAACQAAWPDVEKEIRR